VSPAQAREVLSAADRRVERILLELRLADGLPISLLTMTERDRLPDLLASRLAVVENDMLILSREGRLLADGVIRNLLD
jgi:oxygen-independent coproporphyrinogen-3 oxidase